MRRMVKKKIIRRRRGGCRMREPKKQHPSLACAPASTSWRSMMLGKSFCGAALPNMAGGRPTVNWTPLAGCTKIAGARLAGCTKIADAGSQALGELRSLSGGGRPSCACLAWPGLAAVALLPSPTPPTRKLFTHSALSTHTLPRRRIFFTTWAPGCLDSFSRTGLSS